jgi:LDH2 family malate/lactate/ureidoglycolate dehydrogenase
MLPLGGYKGYGLALMIEILCGVLSGSAFGAHVADDSAQPYRSQNAGHSFVALDIERFMPAEQFKARMKQLVDEIHACQPAQGVASIYVPGEIEMETAAYRRREGIPLPGDVAADLQELGEIVGVPFVF